MNEIVYHQMSQLASLLQMWMVFVRFLCATDGHTGAPVTDGAAWTFKVDCVFSEALFALLQDDLVSSRSCRQGVAQMVV